LLERTVFAKEKPRSAVPAGREGSEARDSLHLYVVVGRWAAGRVAQVVEPSPGGVFGVELRAEAGPDVGSPDLDVGNCCVGHEAKQANALLVEDTQCQSPAVGCCSNGAMIAARRPHAAYKRSGADMRRVCACANVY